MARKWQIASALGRRRISPEKINASSDSEACTPTTTSVAHKGHFIAYTSDGKRFMVPLEYLETRIFQELLRMSEEEYGLPGNGPITLHCDAVSMEYILLLLKKQVSKDVEMALLSSILVPHQSSCSSLAIISILGPTCLASVLLRSDEEGNAILSTDPTNPNMSLFNVVSSKSMDNMVLSLSSMEETTPLLIL
ncbi:hypothetical protein J5N97_001880 [Dioscorea zingiberensis]|uniref:Uncharacterized protein n=1 Tax=Dioscorea zingiberensis TaxID=325984 RepID=A0A9D5BT54_9LILI|nr:hypothetical protein J5N97_001880 [Dioscorea zingiberensis]